MEMVDFTLVMLVQGIDEKIAREWRMSVNNVVVGTARIK